MIYDDDELQQLILGLKAIDDDVTTQAIASYPIFLAAVPPKQLKVLAIRGAMLAVEMSYELGRRSPAVERFIEHIMLEVTPAARL